MADSDIRLELDAEETDEPVVTVTAHTPWGVVRAMAKVTWTGRTILARGVYVEGLGANAIGAAGLIRLLQTILEELNANEIIIEGAARTTGSRAGQRYRLTPEEFALRFGLDVATLRNCEQGRTQPDGPARVFFRVIERSPRTVEETLGAG